MNLKRSKVDCVLYVLLVPGRVLTSYITHKTVGYRYELLLEGKNIKKGVDVVQNSQKCKVLVFE